MKLVNYQLQTQMEYLSKDKPVDFFKEYCRSILEDSSKTYYQKADYIGLSMQELKNKIDSLSKDISELQQLKKKLSSSLEIAKEVTATILLDNGIDRIDGNIISSITLTKEDIKTKKSINILDQEAVMKLGYIKYEPDMNAIEQSLQTKEGKDELKEFVSVQTTTTTTPSRVKVNTRRSSPKIQADELINIVEKVA